MLVAALMYLWFVGNASSNVFLGMLISHIFSAQQEPTTSRGYNPIGAICGGLLEYSSMALGTNNLFLLALVLYILVFLVHGRENN